ncbi:MAG: xylose isomerase [Myxococcales bacterium]
MSQSNSRYPKDRFAPRPEDHFTWGLWTVGNTGRDPFGLAVREPMSAAKIVRELSQLGAYGVNLHDEDLIPFEATAGERDRILREFKGALSETGMKVPMATTNLFSQPVFREGAFTSNDAGVRAFALQKTMRSIDLGVELGATTYVFWGGREGLETNACKTPQDGIKRFREAMNFLTSYVRDNKYDLKFALEAKPNEPRGDIFLPTTGHMLAFIYTLDHAEMVGVNPEVAHEQMPGLDFSHGVGQALEAGKLFHIDLNGQKPGRYDQDLRFASEDQKGAFFLVKLLEDARWEGMRHFDSHAYRTEDEQGVWDFAYASMRSYNILKEKVAKFHADPEIREILRSLEQRGTTPVAGVGPGVKYDRALATSLKAHSFDVGKLAARGYDYERLDQLTTEVLLGVR